MNQIKKELASGKYEKTGNGSEIYLPQSRLLVGGVFENWVNDDKENSQLDSNLVVNEGLDYMLDVALSSGTQKTNWYVSIFKANYTPLATDTAQTISTNSTEVTGSGDISETARQIWIEPGVASQSITNSASPAVFTATGTLTAYGAFLISTSAYGNGISSDKLLAAAPFSAPRALVATDVLNVTYTLNIATV